MFEVELELETDLETKGPEFIRVLNELPKAWILEGGEIYESQMYMEVPISSGRLQSSIYQKIFNDYVEIWTNTGYGKAVDEGRRGFTVYPRTARVLRFFIGSRVVFATVSHPGPAKANRFTQRTLINAAPRVMGMIETVYKQKVGAIS